METNDFDIDLLGDSPGMGDSEMPMDSPSDSVTEGVDVAEEVAPVESAAEPVVAEVVEPAAPTFEMEGVELTDRERALLARLEEVTGQRQAAPAASADEPAPVAAASPNFLEGLDLDEVFSNPESFNALLGRVHAQGMQEASRLAAENIMRSLPSIISTYVAQHITTRETVENFYKENPELRAVRRTVAQVANEVASAEPELSLDQVFAKSADRVYTMLNLKKGSIAKEVRKPPANPGFVNHRSNGTRAVKTPELSGLAKEIGELLEI